MLDISVSIRLYSSLKSLVNKPVIFLPFRMVLLQGVSKNFSTFNQILKNNDNMKWLIGI